MAPSSNENQIPQPSRFFIWICRGLCAVALGVSGYLAWTAYTATPVFGCGAGEVFDCSHVLTSEYAKVLGIPVSVPAIALYSVLLIALTCLGKDVKPALARTAWAVLTAGTVSAALAAIWFTGVQVFKLEHLCMYCLTAHICGILLAGMILWSQPLGWKPASGLAGLSMTGVAAMIGLQVTAEPADHFVMERYESVDMEVNAGAEEFRVPNGAGEVQTKAVEFTPPGFDDNGTDLFAPPVTDDNLFAPPVPMEVSQNAPVVAPPVITPPVAEDQLVESAPSETTETPREAEIPDFTTSAPAEDVSSDEDAEPDSDSPAVAASALLFISPSTSGLLIRFLNTPIVSDESSSADNDGAQRTVQKPVAPPERLVSVAGSKFSLNTRHWPLIGKPDAKYVLVEMFDYTCPHCRQTHHAIDGAFDELGEDLAIIALPVPLDPSCNDAVRNSGHAGACELARLSVAVWRCDPSSFRAYHDWLFAGHRSTATARRKAEELVGRERLAAELALPHAQNYVLKHVELYKRVGRGAVPKLMFPKSTMTGQVSSSRTLVSTIRRELGN